MKKIFLVILLVLVGAAMFACSNSKGIASIVQNKSRFDDFQVEDNMVYIYCTITLKNNSTSEMKVRLLANMKDDVNIGLLKDGNLYGTNREDDTQIFSIPANTDKEFDVVFIGEYAGVNKKTNRLLPNIKVEIVSQPITTTEE